MPLSPAAPYGQEGELLRGGDAAGGVGRGGCVAGLAFGGILIEERSALNRDYGSGENTHQKETEKRYKSVPEKGLVKVAAGAQ